MHQGPLLGNNGGGKLSQSDNHDLFSDADDVYEYCNDNL
jgi:hypothetical protein